MACDEAAGIVVGTFFGTLFLVAVILGVAFLVWRRRLTQGKTKKAVGTSKETYENPAFNKDAETNVKPHNGDANKAGRDIQQTAYTELRETSSPHAKDVTDNAVHAGRSKSKARRNLFTEAGSRSLDFPIHKAGSHGSLDGAVTPNFPELISVALQSQDIIGLGFNISGSLSEGIFVSQVHNRGPASESGKIQVGDRILSITISMKNMVYEDALTILSYASPYPVILQLQKAMPIPDDDELLDTSKLGHPVYRSQSLDDLSKINRDRWTGPRKTWTQIRRRPRPSRDEDREEIEGQLKKWSATQNIVNEESGLVQATDYKTSASNLSTDISLDMDEMLGISSNSMLTSTPGGAQVLQVHVPDEPGSKRRSGDDDGDFPSKRFRDSVSENGDAAGKQGGGGKSSSSDSVVKGGDGKRRKKPGSGGDSESEDETIPKGGIAYYVRIDEGLEPPTGSAPFHYDYNPKGIMNKPQLVFSDGTVATTSNKVEAAHLSSQLEEKKRKEAEKQQRKQSNNPSSEDTFYDVELDTTDREVRREATNHRVSNENLNNHNGAYLMQVKSQDSEA